MRLALDAWMDDIKDLGDEPEEQMVQRVWPGGLQPQTAAPVILPRTSIDTERKPTITVNGPVEMMMYCPTQGASIAYTLEEGENPHWNLYTGPLLLTGGATQIRARAVRYGYKESEETAVTVTVSPK